MARKTDDDAGFVEFLLEQLRELGPEVRAKRMFGGHGIYFGDLMFGLVAWGTFYLKVDGQNAPAFEARGLGPFVYEAGNGKRAVMSYHECPPEAMDDAEVMAEWAGEALAAAQRAQAGKAAKAERAARSAERKAATSGKKKKAKTTAKKKPSARQKKAKVAAKKTAKKKAKAASKQRGTRTGTSAGKKRAKAASR